MLCSTCELFTSKEYSFMPIGKLVTSGGRVLGITETAPSLEAAIRKAYETVSEVKFENAFYRKDIGARALMAERK